MKPRGLPSALRNHCGLAAIGAALAPVEGLDRALGVAADHEPAAADAGALRLDHVQRQHRGDRGVGSAAALAQHLGARLCGAGIGGADDSCGLGLRRAGDRIAAGGASREGERTESQRAAAEKLTQNGDENM